MSNIEEELFEEADERLDNYFKEKKENIIYKAEE